MLTAGSLLLQSLASCPKTAMQTVSHTILRRCSASTPLLSTRTFPTTPTTPSTTSHPLSAAHIHTSSSHNGQNPQPAQREGQQFNVGVFGAGRIGKLHLKNVLRHRQLKLQWVAEDSQQAQDSAREELFLHDTPFIPSSHVPSLLQDESLDGVFVLTPTETHADLIMKALHKGKSVFVEKPTAETAEQTEQCYSLADSKGVHLFTGFQRRHDPAMQDMYSAVRERGEVGKVHNIKTVSRDSPKPSYDFLNNCDPNGCNILSDMAVHDVDMLVWLTQEEVPEMIYVVTHAHDVRMAESGVEDTLMVVIKYKSGVIATIDSCRETSYGYDIRLEVFGSEGMVRVENPREASIVRDGSGGGSVRRLFNSFPQRFEKAFQLQLDSFVRCLEGRETPPVTKAQALLTARIIDKGVQSFRENRPVYF